LSGDAETDRSDRRTNDACCHAVKDRGNENERVARPHCKYQRRDRDHQDANCGKCTLPSNRVGQGTAGELRNDADDPAAGQNKTNVLLRPAAVREIERQEGTEADLDVGDKEVGPIEALSAFVGKSSVDRLAATAMLRNSPAVVAKRMKAALARNQRRETSRSTARPSLCARIWLLHPQAPCCRNGASANARCRRGVPSAFVGSSETSTFRLPARRENDRLRHFGDRSTRCRYKARLPVEPVSADSALFDGNVSPSLSGDMGVARSFKIPGTRGGTSGWRFVASNVS